MLSAPTVGRHNSTRVDEGRKSWFFLAIKMQDTNRSGVTGGGKEPAMWPRIWGTARRQRKRRAKIINGMAKIYLEYVYIFEFVQWPPWCCASTLITDKQTQIEETKGNKTFCHVCHPTAVCSIKNTLTSKYEERATSYIPGTRPF